MTKKVSANASNGIVGLSGRTLTVGRPHILAIQIITSFLPSFQLTAFMRENACGGEFRVGLKSLHDLFPAKVREKINAEGKQKWWDEPYKKAAAEILRKTSAVEKKTPVGLAEKLAQENNEALAEIHNNLEKKFTELKTTYDCVTFKGSDGLWYAVIDTTETVSIRSYIHLTYLLMIVHYHPPPPPPSLISNAIRRAIWRMLCCSPSTAARTT